MSRNSKTSAAQQLKLVMECRRSGKTDVQWCIENGIRPATFYNWVSRYADNHQKNKTEKIAQTQK